jgi:hypothetical protein
MTAKTNTAKYRETALKVVYANSNENMQADTKINHDRKSVTCIENLDTSQLNILTMNDDRHLINSAESLERHPIES